MSAIDHETPQAKERQSARYGVAVPGEIGLGAHAALSVRRTSPTAALIQSAVIAAVAIGVALSPGPMAALFGLVMAASTANALAVGLALLLALLAVVRAATVLLSDDRVVAALARFDQERAGVLPAMAPLLAVIAILCIVALIFLGQRAAFP